MGRRWLLLWCALAGCGNAQRLGPPTPEELCPPEVCPAVEAGQPAQVRGEQPYAITISGGVSLGSYEAGLNWTVVELLRNARDHTADLEGVTGASAGSINSLLTSIRWCQSDKVENAVDDNLFADAWLGIGFDELLPGDPEDYATADDPRTYGADLLMSRKKAFAEILAEVKDLLTAGQGFRKCDLRLGMTVTSRDPKSLVISDLHVSNQRYVIPLRVRSDGTSIEFEVDTRIRGSARKELLGNLLFLAPDHVISDPDDPKRRRFVIDPPKVLRAALASSAFPGAFGPIELTHCVEQEPAKKGQTPEERDRRTCSGGQVSRSSKCHALGKALGMQETAVQCTQRFIDGGVFDNVPLGVAMAQLESELEPRPLPAAARRPLRYIYMYYNNRRGVPARGPGKPSEAAEKRKGPVDGPLGDTLTAVSGILDTAEDYELHNVLRYNRWNAGTSKQAYAIAELIMPAEKGEEDEPVAIDSALSQAEELERMAQAFAPTSASAEEKRRIARRLRDLAWALEQFSLSGADFLTVQDKVLEALAILCKKLGRCPSDAIADLQLDVRNNRELVLTRRFSPLTGMHVTHFGAFFDRAFREYDYYAGIYDGLVNEAFRRCEAKAREPLNEVEQAVAQQAVQSAPPPAPVAAPRRRAKESKDDCLYQEFVAARRQLGIDAGPAFQVTQRLWAMEHHARPPRYPEGKVGQVMEALFSPARCGDDKVETLTDNGYCVHDLGLEPFLEALKSAEYEPESKFLVFAARNPSRWWMLPAAYGTERATELARAEKRGTIAFAAALAASYVEVGVDSSNDDILVAPSSLPRRLGLVPRSLFPFFAISMHPTRRAELGVVRGGFRLGRPEFLLRKKVVFDLLADAAARVSVRPRRPEEEDNGYGLFTRGAIVPQLSGSLVAHLRSPVLSSLGVRSGIPVTVANLGPPSFTFEEQVNAELDVVLMGDKIRFAAGCHPLAPPPNQDCWRDIYITFGVNDLAGLAYWTGTNPFKIDRLAIPFVAPRLPFNHDLWSDGVAVETGLLRAGYQPFWWAGLWADTSIIASNESTWNGSVSFEMRPARAWKVLEPYLESLAVRWGFPLTIRDDARAADGNLEVAVVVLPPFHLRLAAGGFPARDEGEDDPLQHPYFSLGVDPGSIPVWLYKQFAGQEN